MHSHSFTALTLSTFIAILFVHSSHFLSMNCIYDQFIAIRRKSWKVLACFSMHSLAILWKFFDLLVVFGNYCRTVFTLPLPKNPNEKPCCLNTVVWRQWCQFESSLLATFLVREVDLDKYGLTMNMVQNNPTGLIVRSLKFCDFWTKRDMLCKDWKENGLILYGSYVLLSEKN